MKLEMKKIETRLLEVEEASYVKESGKYVLRAIHLAENKRWTSETGLLRIAEWIRNHTPLFL